MSAVLDILFYVGILVLGLSILVIVHELGHFLPAKWFGMRVEKFYVFFDWPRKIWSTKKGETEYGVGMLPLGGYVKIAGIIDESMDKAHLSQPKQPWEFRSKPVWQRMVVMVGGVTMNVLLAILIFSVMAFFNGQQHLKNDSLAFGVYVSPGSVGDSLGFQTGDRLVSFKGQPIDAFPLESDLINYLIEEDGYFEVARGTERVQLPIPANFLDKLADRQKEGGFEFLAPNYPPVIGEVAEGYPAAKAGLQVGDRILAVHNTPIQYFGEMRDVLQARKGQPTAFQVLRGADTLAVSAALDSTGLLGVAVASDFLVFERTSYGFFGSIAQGTRQSFGIIGNQLKAFGKMFRGDLAVQKNLSGPVRIGQFLGDGVKAGGAIAFLNIVATLSMVLAFVNILPIPALDGGHLVFLIWEAIARKEPSLKVRMAAQQVGVLLVIGLSVFVIFNDILNL